MGFKRNSFVDLLKGLAISAVILLHAFEWPEPLLGFLQLAVPVFILLMAYNFSQSWQAKPFLKRYLFRRAKRLLPVFLAAWFFVVENRREKKWTPAMTVPQIQEGIACLVHAAADWDGPTRVARERTRRLERNQLARLYHWKRHNKLPPLNLEKRQI